MAASTSRHHALVRYGGKVSEQARSDDEQRARARAWQREQARKTLAEIRAGAPGHREVSEAEIDQAVDVALAALDHEVQHPPSN